MSESIGGRLREAREKRQLSLQQASDITKVRAHYLQALENDDLSAMPSAAQARGFLRIYADFLGLQVTDLVPPAPPVAAVEPEPAPTASGGPKTAPRKVPAAPSKEPRSSLLDNVRDLLSRRGKQDAMRTAVEPAGTTTDPTGNGSVPGGSSDDSLNSAKKKAAK